MHGAGRIVAIEEREVMEEKQSYYILEMPGYDPEKCSGFAFGVGIERVAMLKYGIDDMRILQVLTFAQYIGGDEDSALLVGRIALLVAYW